MEIRIIKKEYEIDNKVIVSYKAVLDVDYQGQRFYVEMKPYNLGLNRETYDAFIKSQYKGE